MFRISSYLLHRNDQMKRIAIFGALQLLAMLVGASLRWRIHRRALLVHRSDQGEAAPEIPPRTAGRGQRILVLMAPFVWLGLVLAPVVDSNGYVDGVLHTWWLLVPLLIASSSIGYSWKKKIEGQFTNFTGTQAP